MTDNIKPLALYAEVKRVKETCEYGDKHEVTYYTRKMVTPTGETWLCDNGYEKTRQPVYVDAQGRRYLKYVAIDYFNNVSYRRESDSRRFNHRPEARFARFIDGTPLNDKTPVGPALRTEVRTVVL